MGRHWVPPESFRRWVPPETAEPVEELVAEPGAEPEARPPADAPGWRHAGPLWLETRGQAHFVQGCADVAVVAVPRCGWCWDPASRPDRVWMSGYGERVHCDRACYGLRKRRSALSEWVLCECGA